MAPMHSGTAKKCCLILFRLVNSPNKIRREEIINQFNDMLKQKSVSQWDAGRGSVHGRSHHRAQFFIQLLLSSNENVKISTWISCTASPGEVEF
jgi:hypothetical protein